MGSGQGADVAEVKLADGMGNDRLPKVARTRLRVTAIKTEPGKYHILILNLAGIFCAFLLIARILIRYRVRKPPNHPLLK